MDREQILNEIAKLGIDFDEEQNERFRQLFENTDNLEENIESIISTDWTYFRYLPQELQNNPKIIRMVQEAKNGRKTEDDIDLNDLNIVQKIQLAVDESRKQQEHIDELIQEMRNETRIVRVEELRQEIERLTQEHQEYDEMTNNAYNRVYNHLNKIINNLVVENIKNPLNDGKKYIFNNAIERREGLLKISRNNMDILHLLGTGDSKSDSTVRSGGFGGNNGNGNNGGNGGDSGAGSTGNGDIDYEIEEFKNHYDELLGDINKLRASLVLGTGLESLNINNEIIKLGKELKELDREANELISDIDEFRKNAFGENPSMTVPEIKASMKNIKDRLLELKKSQIEKYNSRVNEINTKIDELKALTDVPENVANMINNLNKLNLCDDITTYKDVNYLDKINYDDMVDRYNRINEIEKELGRERKPDSINFELDSDIHHIEEEIARVNYYISDTMTRDAINSLNQSIIGISVSITEFKAKLEQNKDKLSLDDYRVYLEIIDEDELILNDLADKLSKIKDVDKENTVYQDFLTRLNNLSKYASSLENLVDALKGNIFENTVDIFKSKIVGARSSLNLIKAEIEQAYSEGKLDNVQYNNLNNKMNEIEEVINRAGYKLLDPEMVLSGDTFSLINGNIDRLEDEIIILENRVNELQKPIKDRKVKKEIDNTIANLEREIKVIRSILKDHKDEDEDKYQASVDRLNQLEDRLSQVGKKYRSKCPLRVKSVKSAKAFYKKHKKPILIAAGIAALAVELAVGPVIIPAIIKGNLLLKDKLPFGKSAFVGINNVLAGLINAKSKAGIIIKSSGEVINIGKNVNLCTSLLKGVALSGLGTAAIVAPVVGSIKALMEKMKQKELKKQMSHPQNNIRLSDDNKNILFDEYKKFNRSAEEFVEFYGLDQKFIEILNNLDNERTLEEEDTDRRAR